MSKLPLLILAIIAFAAGAAGQTWFQTIDGQWKGTLEYSDYTSGKRVTMGTLITITASPDGRSATFKTIYDDFGKIYRSNGTARIDPDTATFIEDGIAYSIESGTPGKLVLIGKTKDGNKTEPTRKTLTLTADTLTMLKETRSPWQFRNVYTLRRVAPVPAPAILTPEEMAKDLDLLERTFDAIHPGAYRYITREALTSEFRTARRRVAQPLKEADFFVIVAQLASKLRCGHTYTNFYNQDERLKARLFGPRNLLPFHFEVVDGRFIITANASAKDVPLGTEILSINGVAVGDIISKLLTVTRADGDSTLAHRIDSISLRRGDAESNALFDWFFPMFFPVKDGVLDIEAAGAASPQNRLKFSVLAMTKEERTAEMAKRYGPPPTYDDGWKFTIRPDGIGYLRIDNSITWRLKTVKVREFLAVAFAELRKRGVGNLIVDLRGNGGGSMDPGFELARYLAPRRLGRYAATLRLVRNVSPQPDLAPFLGTYSDELSAAIRLGVPATMFKRADGEYFEITGREGFPEVEPYGDRFTGKTMIIADSSNASATFQFLDFVKQNRLATIVGQETGGNRQGINGGNYFFLKLPNSSIEVDIPVYFQAPPEPRPDEPVLPDVYVKRRAEDIGNGYDRELGEAIRLMRDGN